MLKRKIILVFFIFLMVFQIGFFVSSDKSQENPELTIIEQLDLLKGEGNLDYLISEDEKTIDLILGEGNFEFGENSIEHLSTENSPTSKLVINMSGNVLEASLFNGKASKYVINGNEFDVPADSHFAYDGEIYSLAKGTKINKFVLNNTFIGEDISFFDGFRLKSVGVGDTKTMGKCSLTNLGYLLEGGEANYKGLKITSRVKGNVLIVKDSFFDLSNYKGNYIKETKDGLKIQSYGDKNIYMTFLEDNGFFDMSDENLEVNQEKTLKISIGGGDSVEIFNNPKYFEGTMIPEIRHTSNDGFAAITNGRHVFKLKDNKLITSFGDLNTRNHVASRLDITSDIQDLSGKILSVGDNSKYVIKDIKLGDLTTFNIPLNGDLDYEFTSVENEKMYRYAEALVGNSAYREGGRGCVGYFERGDKYIKEEVPLDDFLIWDCVGISVEATKEIHGVSIPPDLRAFDILKDEKGMETGFVEPASVIGEEMARQGVENIPAGAMVFLMHPYDRNPGGKEGEDYIKYTNQNGEEKYLKIGHTYTKSITPGGFINALPTYDPNKLPKRAREYNEKLALEGKPLYFTGVVKEGYLAFTKDDYLYFGYF